MGKPAPTKYILTEAVVKQLDPPATSQKIYLDAEQEHFGVRVLASGSRAWVLERRLDGKTIRRTLGDADGPRALRRKEALREFAKVNGSLLKGEDKVAEERDARRAVEAQKKEDGLTFAAALKEYVKGKTRMKNGEPIKLKPRTVADYLSMVEPGGTRENGAPKVDGPLYPLADKPITRITGEEVKALHDKLAKTAPRRAGYGMQVLRAVFNWHGIQLPGNPMGKEVAARDRVVLKTTGNSKNPIKARHLGAWWRAACAAGGSDVGGSSAAADYYMFQLLTGCRGVEIMGDDYGNDPIRVRDVDLVDGCIIRRDTKNRLDHTIFLSRQALEIVKRRAEGKKASAALFDVGDPKKTLRAINKAAGLTLTAHSGHDLRATFGSIANELVNKATVSKLLNHSTKDDVTLEHYVTVDDDRLRAAWQAVADFIEAAAVPTESAPEDAPQPNLLPDNVAPLRARSVATS